MQSGVPAAGFRCECWQVDCNERIPLSETEWEEVRSEANRFAVTPGHVAADLEAVIKKHPNFWLVEKHGEAGGGAKKVGEPPGGETARGVWPGKGETPAFTIY